MRQNYYLIHNDLFGKLVGNIEVYNKLLKATFDKSIPREERLKAMEDKGKLEEKIVAELKNNGQLLGFFTEKEFDSYKNSIDLLRDEIRKFLDNNTISYDSMDEILGELMKHDNNRHIKKLSVFLENAKKQDKSIVVWIM